MGAVMVQLSSVVDHGSGIYPPGDIITSTRGLNMESTARNRTIPTASGLHMARGYSAQGIQPPQRGRPVGCNGRCNHELPHPLPRKDVQVHVVAQRMDIGPLQGDR